MIVSALSYHRRWFRVGFTGQTAASVYFLQLGYYAVYLTCQITSSRYVAWNNIAKIGIICRERADIAIPLESP